MKWDAMQERYNTLPSPESRGQRSAIQGRWGEEIAMACLLRLGWRIVGRNVRPCRRDQRCELDIVAYVPGENRIVFVEVKTHKHRSSHAGRLWAVNARKKKNILRASANWLMRQRWHGNYRFDVVEIYGEKGGCAAPVVDHIQNVPLFPPSWRFR